MASTTEPIRVIVCGKTAETGKMIADLIKPHMEVIQWINSFEYAKDNLADLLAGRPPTSPSDDPVGTHNYGQLPRAIIFGRAFPHEQAKELNRLFRGSSAKPVAWIVGDPDVVPPAHPGPDYAAKGAAHVKAAFSKWNASGGNTDDILYY